ncbi:MAG: hypothetical protein EOP84_04615 [Verrucomicrobiaceae bacterium]|nr:MAG: hypothetical protein EOP84_04615 [Verrucomicrobiaceae bacterium]
MRSRRPPLWFALLALAAVFPGVLVGRALRGHDATSPVDRIRDAPALATNDGREHRQGEAAREVRETAAAPLVVPPDVIHRIEIQLMDGAELNRQECRLIGMGDSQIKSLAAAVRDYVSRWREREKAAVKVIPSTQPGLLLHIPAADSKVVEAEYDALMQRVREDAGPGLEPLVHMRLTDGYTPRSQSNRGTGMLNVMTGGFGSLERFIKVTPAYDGSWVYEVTDVLPRDLNGVPVDESIFAKFGESLSFDCRRTYLSGRDAAAISHLPRPE